MCSTKRRALSDQDVALLACMSLASLHQCGDYLNHHLLQRHACILQTQSTPLATYGCSPLENLHLPCTVNTLPARYLHRKAHTWLTTWQTA